MNHFFEIENIIKLFYVQNSWEKNEYKTWLINEDINK